MGVFDNLSVRLQGDPVQKAFRLRERGRSDRAIESLQKFHQSHPDNLSVGLHLAAFQMEAGTPEPALDVLRHAFQRDADNSQEIHILVDQLRIPKDQVWPIFLTEAETAIRREDHSEALRQLETIPAETRRILEKRYRSRFEQSLPKDASRPLPANRLVPAYLAALMEESLGRVTEAAGIYRALLARNPQERENIARRFEALLATDYKNLDLRLSLAEMHVELEKMDQAVQEFQLALEMNPAEAPPELARRLQALLDKDNDQPSLRWLHLQAAAAAGIDDDTLQRIRKLTDDGHFIRESIQLLSARLEERADPEGALLLAHLYLRFGRASEAMEWIEKGAEGVDEDRLAQAYDEVIRERPDYPPAYMKLADICLRRGNSDRALLLFRTLTEKDNSQDTLIRARLREFVENNREHVGAQRVLADLLYRRGEIEKATILLRHIVRVGDGVEPDLIEFLAAEVKKRADAHHLRLGLAEALAAAGRPAEALQEIANLAARAPKLAAEFLHLLSQISLEGPQLAAKSLPVFEQLIRAKVLPDAVHFGKAQALAASGRPQNAIELFRRMLKHWPARQPTIEAAVQQLATGQSGSPELHYALVEMALRRGDFRKATETLRGIRVHDPEKYPGVLKLYMAAVKRDPRNLDARLGLSSAYLAGRYYRRVLELGRETLRTAGDVPLAGFRIDMGDAHRELRELDSAARMYLTAFQAEPALAPKLLERLQDLIRIDPTVGQAHLALGVVSLNQGNLEEGIGSLLDAWRQEPAREAIVLQHLEKLCSLNPTLPAIPLAMVTLLRETGKVDRAIVIIGELLDCAPRVADRVAVELQGLLRRSPKSAIGWFHLGRAHQIQEDPSRAVEAFERAYRLDSELTSRILTCLRQLGRDHAASADVCRTLGILSSAAGKHLEGARWIQRAIGRNESEKERYLKDLEETAQKDPQNAQLILILGTEYGRAGHLDKAFPCYETALSFDESLHQEIRICVTSFVESGTPSPAAHLVRFRTWMLAGRPTDAVADLRDAGRHGAQREQILAGALDLHREFPDHGESFLFLLDLLIAAGETGKAADLLDRRAGGDWKPAERIALLLRRWRVNHLRGDRRRASESLREAESIAPDRNQLLTLIHRFLIRQRQMEIQAVEVELRHGEQMDRLPELVAGLIELGDCDRAFELLTEFRQGLPPETARRLAAAAYRREGFPSRALEPLQGIEPGIELPLAAEAAGNLPLAAAALERLLDGGSDPVLEKRLKEHYRTMALQELEGGAEKLVGETVLQYSA